MPFVSHFSAFLEALSPALVVEDYSAVKKNEGSNF
jgi:hypothetical protein